MSAKQQDHNRDPLSPTAGEFILLLLDELYDLLLWIARFNLTKFIARIVGRSFDPEGSRLPEWNREATTPPPDVDDIDVSEGGYPIGFDGDLIRSEKTTKARATAEKKLEQQEEISIEEWEIMKNYNPPLLNIPLARKIKRYWREGHTDRDAAMLSGCSPSYAKHYRLAFEKAARQTTA